MLKIVTVPEQVFSNIRRFEDELERSPDLQARLAYARAWYAYADENMKWHFGPSKFVGYEGMDAKTYLRVAETIDGRQTEAHLQKWFKAADRMHPGLYDDLNEALVAFLAKYNKAPSTKMRISVRSRMARPTPGSYDKVVDLMIAVASTLPTEHFKQLRAKLDDIWL